MLGCYFRYVLQFDLLILIVKISTTDEKTMTSCACKCKGLIKRGYEIFFVVSSASFQNKEFFLYSFFYFIRWIQQNAVSILLPKSWYDLPINFHRIFKKKTVQIISIDWISLIHILNKNEMENKKLTVPEYFSYKFLVFCYWVPFVISFFNWFDDENAFKIVMLFFLDKNANVFACQLENKLEHWIWK